MNLTYPGSVAERKMHFRSSVVVESADNSELFHAISIYVPKAFSAANIVEFDPSIVDADNSAVIIVTVDNYREELQGDLLAQVTPMFRDDTNFELSIVLVVFHDTETADWAITSKSIQYAPLTKAFSKMFFVSYAKMLFDPNYDGRDVIVPATPGTKAHASLIISNPTAGSLTISAGTYSYVDGSKTWPVVFAADTPVAAGASLEAIAIEASAVGSDSTMTNGEKTWPDLTVGLVATVSGFVQGTAATSQTTRPSTYFDMALALAYLCRANGSLSWYFAYVHIALPIASTDTNKCWARSKTREQELAAMTSLVTADRSKYFWAALVLIDAANTSLSAHSEESFILASVFAKWFTAKNAAGMYVGNKMSMLTLSGNGIKAFGTPSPLNSSINENDEDGFDIFDTKNIGYLMTISKKSDVACALSMMRGVTGIPAIAQMISKYIDYSCAQECAELISAEGTVTNPALTDEATYKTIQSIVESKLLLFVGTRRIKDIQLTFPAFSDAKTGMTKLEAASAWKATYTDDIDEITVTGGIVAQ